jgi:hypothetical protein
MSVELRGPSGDKLVIDTDGAASVKLPIDESKAGFAAMVAENDSGDELAGVRELYAVEVSKDYRVRTGQDNMVFNESFPGGAVNTSQWLTAVVTMTSGALSGFAVLNAASSLVSGAYAMMRTYRHFPCYKQYTTYAEMEVQFSSIPQVGNKCEWGLMLVVTTAAPTDGAFFRLQTTGNLSAVLCYNSVEEEVQLDPSLFEAAVTKSYLIYIGSTFVQFWINNVKVAHIDRPEGTGSATSSMNLPLSFRNYNTVLVSNPQVMRIGNVNVTFGDQALNKPWGHVMSGMGAASAQGQTGATLQSTAIMSNAAPAAALALSNTAPAAQNLGLGGVINVLPTLIAGTDGILCSYQVPIGTATLPGRSLYLTDFKVQSTVTTVLAGGPVVYLVGIAYGHFSGANLTVTEGIASKSPRRIPMGYIVHTLNAPVAETPAPCELKLTSGAVVVHPGEYVQITLRNVGVVTTTGALMMTATLHGYWE